MIFVCSSSQLRERHRERTNEVIWLDVRLTMIKLKALVLEKEIKGCFLTASKAVVLKIFVTPWA
ncbi:MAG: hypothetical protein CMJ76_00050 [Planctomycetaceae bacterium]|nr:hypothetical protein [Planctomycetaceae bacterium]